MMSELLPIREISRLTGVNTVTLRAWERRYGLLKPSRTHKGHRLYSADDVELVKTIQAWLARGLAISKVSELLERNPKDIHAPIENIWNGYFQDVMAIVSSMSLGKLESFFNDIFAIYPADIITDQLIAPVLENLHQLSFGNAVKRAIFTNRLIEDLHMLIQRQRQQASGTRIVIIQLSAESNQLLNVLLHYGLTMNQYRCENMGIVSVNEIVFLQEHLAPEAIVVYNDSATTLLDFQKSLDSLARKVDIPVVVGGKLIDALSVGEIAYPPNVIFAENNGQQSVTAKLNTVFRDEHHSSESGRRPKENEAKKYA